MSTCGCSHFLLSVDGVIRSSHSHLSVKQPGRTPRQPAGTERTAVCLKERERGTKDEQSVCPIPQTLIPVSRLPESKQQVVSWTAAHGQISGGARTDQGQQMEKP